MLSWQTTIVDTAFGAQDLPAKLDALLARQRSSWPALAAGEAALAGMRTRRLQLEDVWITVQSNPGRAGSTLARVDPQAIAARPCFLCPQNMPEQERGLAFGELVLLPNPYPILPRHLTIPTREHSEQRLGDRIDLMFELARALGPDMLVFYNGPTCGASAPDHFHFQACQRAGVPILSQLPGPDRPERIAFVESFGRCLAVDDRTDPGLAAAELRRLLSALAELQPGQGEPPLNLLAQATGQGLRWVLFPRARHRPACFFEAEPERISVSPAALEMAGLLVVAEPAHFDRVDARTAASIYAQVSLDAERFGRLVREFGGGGE